LVRYDGLVEDITERWRAEQALRETEVQLLAAAKIQERLLPAAPPLVPAFDIAGAVYPAAFTAGDFFDYLAMPDGNVGFVVSDVSGHGFGPSLLMASASTLFRLLAETHLDLGEIMAKVNRFLAKETDDDEFVTLLLVCLNPRTGSIVYASAGHPPGYVLDASGAVKAQLQSTGFPLAVSPDSAFPVAGPVKLDPGDIVLLMTDGLHDAASLDGAAYGSGRVLEIVRANRTKTASAIINNLYRDVCEFSHREKPVDDVTLVVIKVESC
jgi:serine phosphatase RsbU (regulator of sigma subunit)